MTVYTRSGDDGSCSNGAGKRLRKTDVLMEAIGDLDELNSHLGLSLESARHSRHQVIGEAIEQIQPGLLTICSILAGANTRGLDDSSIGRMERQIDDIVATVGQPKGFVVPGGCQLACLLHVGRAICRRAERRVVALADAGHNVPSGALAYINRLSDLLFALALLANHNHGNTETHWPPPVQQGT